jgi:hypothetical protein
VRERQWDVELQDRGQCGSIAYREGDNVAVLGWEFGGRDVVVIVTSPSSHVWDDRYPWAAGRQGEVLERVGSWILDCKAPGCRVDFDPRSPEFLYVREGSKR